MINVRTPLLTGVLALTPLKLSVVVRTRLVPVVRARVTVVTAE